jgi:Protein of unknown function (DUF2934)
VRVVKQVRLPGQCLGAEEGFAYPKVDAPYVGGESSEGDSGMAETVKKAKAPAKPRTTSAKAKAKAAVEEVRAVTPSHEEIAQLAQKFWAERGWQDGYAEQDWLRAEQELIGRAS